MKPTALHVRPLQREDADILAGWGEDDLFCHHAGWTVSSQAALHDFWVRQVEDPPAELVRLAAEDADRELVGYVDLQGLEPGEKELGFVIGPSCRWGQGLGRRAGEAGLVYGFEELSLDRIWAEAVATNTASVRILRSLGMQETGPGGPGPFLHEDSHYLQFHISRLGWKPKVER